MSGKTHKATFYVQVKREPGSGRWHNNELKTATASAITQGKPSSLPKDTVAVKLTIELPAEAFEAFEPSAVIQVPANSVTGRQPMHVIVEAP